MTLNGKDHDVTDKDLLELAMSFDIKCGQKILDVASNAVGNFSEYATSAGLEAADTDLIKQNLRPLL